MYSIDVIPNGPNERRFQKMWLANRRFWFNGGDEPPPQLENICQWGREMVLKPFINLMIFLGATSAFIMSLQYMFVGMEDGVVRSGLWWTMFWTVVVVVVAVIAIAAVFMAFAFVDSYLHQRKIDRMNAPPDREPTWPELLWARWHSLTNGICIKFVRVTPTPESDNA